MCLSKLIHAQYEYVYWMVTPSQWIRICCIKLATCMYVLHTAWPWLCKEWPREKKATMTWETVTPDLLIWPGVEWVLNQFSFQRAVTATNQHFKLTGWSEVRSWEGNRVLFFDNHITDADAPCYVHANLSWEAISIKAATEKKAKYWLAAEELWGSITPLICSTDGVLHCEYRAYQKRLACCLATKWQKPFSQVVGWVRIHTQFTIFQAVDLRLRGTRQQIWGLGLQDGAAIGVGHQTVLC